MRPYSTTGLLLCAAGLVPTGAMAAGLDVELLQPGTSALAAPWLDRVPSEAEAGPMLGLVGAMSQDPLVLQVNNTPVAGVVAQRSSGFVVVGGGIGDRAALHLGLPIHSDTGGEVPGLSADGLRSGDLSVGARVRLAAAGPLGVGLKGQLLAPTGGAQGWTAETGVRTAAGLLIELQGGPIALLGEVGSLARAQVETGTGVAVGPELRWATALRGDIPGGLLAASVGMHARSPVDAPLGAGEAGAAEALAAIEVRPHRTLPLSLLGGKGLDDGVGAPAWRAGLAVHWRPEPRDRDPGSTPVADTADTRPIAPRSTADDTGIDDLVEAETPWHEGELARVQGDEIRIRTPLQFEQGTATLLPESRPTLVAVAEILVADPRYAHTVVEGHASDEGGHAANYSLSAERARTVWEALLDAGVHPSRVSWRGLGEVQPVAQGEGEKARAMNRRVEFHIVRALGPLEPAPKLDPVPIPWTGTDPEARP